MAYQVVILPTAIVQIADLPKTVQKRIYDRLKWLQDNAGMIIHHPLVGMPSHLSGLCKLRSGDYRILYWKHPEKELVEIFNVRHRSEVYRKL